jgi:hypothetical protein
VVESHGDSVACQRWWPCVRVIIVAQHIGEESNESWVVCWLHGSYPETGLWEAPNSVSKALTEVNSLGPNPRLVIALHSPNALLETGLRMCPPEKSRNSDRLRCRAVRSLQSGLSRHNREIRAISAYFGGRRADFLCSADCVAERGGIRTFGTGLNRVRADVCVSCAESTSSEILPRLRAPHSTR